MYKIFKSASVQIQDSAYNLRTRKEAAPEINEDNERDIAVPDDIPEDSSNNGFADTREEDAGDEDITQITSMYEEAERTVAEAKEKADEIIAEAKRVSETIINNTLDSARERLNKAISEGYALGKEEARLEAEALLRVHLERVRELSDSITASEDTLFGEFRDDMFDIIKRIAERVINREIEQNDEYLVNLFRGAAEGIKHSEAVTITVSESEIVTVTKHREAMMKIIAGVKDFRVVSDKNLPKGTLIVESENGVVDASVRIQTEKANALIDSMKEDLFAAL